MWGGGRAAELRTARRHLRGFEATCAGYETPHRHLCPHRPLRSAGMALHRRVSTDQIRGGVRPVEENGRDNSRRLLWHHPGAHSPTQFPALSQEAEKRDNSSFFQQSGEAAFFPRCLPFTSRGKESAGTWPRSLPAKGVFLLCQAYVHSKNSERFRRDEECPKSPLVRWAQQGKKNRDCGTGARSTRPMQKRERVGGLLNCYSARPHDFNFWTIRA